MEMLERSTDETRGKRYTYITHRILTGQDCVVESQLDDICSSDVTNDSTTLYSLTVNGDAHYHNDVAPQLHPSTATSESDRQNFPRLPYPLPALLSPA